MKNMLFDAAQLYTMLRLSYLATFPYPTSELNVNEVLTLYMHRHLGIDFRLQNSVPGEGLKFSGELYERYKDIDPKRGESFHGNERTAVWYVFELLKFSEDDLLILINGLTQMRLWLKDNGYVCNDRPTDKFIGEAILKFPE